MLGSDATGASAPTAGDDPTPIPGTGTIPLTSLANVIGPVGLGRAASGAGPVVALTPIELFSLIYSRGADLSDADQTIQPFSFRTLFNVLPPATLTANRIFTLGNAGFYTAAGPTTVASIWRLDTSPHTITIHRADGATIYTDPASPPASRLLQFVCNSAGVWAPSAIFLMRA